MYRGGDGSSTHVLSHRQGTKGSSGAERWQLEKVPYLAALIGVV